VDGDGRRFAEPAAAAERQGGHDADAWRAAECLRRLHRGGRTSIREDTSTPKLHLRGSNGGRLVGAADAALDVRRGAAGRGADMLRSTFTIRLANGGDRCRPISRREAYSPLHNIKAASYPPTLVDVGPTIAWRHAHSFAQAAAAAQMAWRRC
jgi:hypothetical protein